MTTPSLHRVLVPGRDVPALLAAAIVATGVGAAPQDASSSGTPLSDAIREATPDVREYDEHLVILSSPWMEGRLPGTRGMELAREYVETQYRDSGLVPPIVDENDGTPSYRQAFNLGGSV